ncbi:MAG: FtsW/RodA/SpoVE family cell cycle protein [Lachnospiraceae bacterium]|nr:FtsW/RodA/SpoVE family cell cycle protein [Lachnospiraceae bacterium]
MELIIAETVKYILTALMILYSFQSFLVFRHKEEEETRAICRGQTVVMVLIQFLSFMVLYLEERDIQIIVYYLVSQTTILAVIIFYSIVYRNSSRLLVNNMCLLLTISFIMLTRLSYYRAIRQVLVAIASLIITSTIPYILMKFSDIRRYYYFFAIFGIVMFLLVLFFSVAVNGSKLNVNIFGVTFQPSEFVKLTFVISMAGFLAKSHKLKDVVITGLIALAHVMLLVLAKDLGSALIFFVVYIVLIYVATGRFNYVLAGSAAGLMAAIAGYKLFSHVRVRVAAFTDPFGTIDNAGYQIAQSLFAIGTGGFFGMGIGQGAPKKIPVVVSDFIFSAIAEEMGVIFAICIILVCLSCFIMFMNISIKFKDSFYKLVGVGIAVIYIFQVFLTIGGVTKFIPLTGVTLPLISYGGNSIMVTLIMFAIIQGLYVNRKKS